MYRAFLIKYSEIGIKGKNRYVFENILKENIRKALDALMPGYTISKEHVVCVFDVCLPHTVQVFII